MLRLIIMVYNQSRYVHSASDHDGINKHKTQPSIKKKNIIKLGKIYEITFSDTGQQVAHKCNN